MATLRTTIAWTGLLVGCGVGDPINPFAESATGGPQAPDTTSSGSTSTGTTTTSDVTTGGPLPGTSEDSDTTPKLDVGVDDMGPPPGRCAVADDMNAIGACDQEAPPDSFEPDIQWIWEGANDETYSIVTPLVANLTDDNGDDKIDLCDTPDIVVVAAQELAGTKQSGHIYVLDGETGAVHFRIETSVGAHVTPAIGDLDHDGVPEIVSARMTGELVIFEHDGELAYERPAWWWGSQSLYFQSLALADLDNDGDVEIIGSNFVANHEGVTVATTWPTTSGGQSATSAVDLDDDGDLELLVANAAHHHDGTMLWSVPIEVAYNAVADFDDDGHPEVLMTGAGGVSLVEHDGTVTWSEIRPNLDSAWSRPPTIHDFDGDGTPEFATSSGSHYGLYEYTAAAPVMVWLADIDDSSGVAAGTAFDFLGDGIAEAMYADETTMNIYDAGTGVTLASWSRASGTLSEYPVVADVDNDGSAEIVVVSNRMAGKEDPTVQVMRDAQDRWIQARRIWNQHTYHVTNVREDGTIPQYEPPHWKSFNTFRTNAQIEDGKLCKPEPEG